MIAPDCVIRDKETPRTKRKLITMAKPIYAGTYSNRGRGRWKRVFIIIVFIQIVIVGIYLWKNKASKSKEEAAAATPAATTAPRAGP